MLSSSFVPNGRTRQEAGQFCLGATNQQARLGVGLTQRGEAVPPTPGSFLSSGGPQDDQQLTRASPGRS